MTSERCEAIVRLLQTRDEHLPEPVRRTEAASGFVHRTKAAVTCPDCLANGKVTFGCETCGGQGFTEEFRERDPYAIGVVLPFGFDVSAHDAARERDRQIGALERQLNRPKNAADELAEANAHPYVWELARRRMYQNFDYAALDRALDGLRDHDHPAYRALHAVYVYRWLAESDALAAHIDRGLMYLDDRLPSPLRAPADRPLSKNMLARGRHADKRAMEQRDAEIRRLAKQMTIADLATHFGLKKSALYEIINREAA